MRLTLLRTEKAPNSTKGKGKDVDTVAQAFADELFRVYRLAHPVIEISLVNSPRRTKAETAAGESPSTDYVLLTPNANTYPH